ncbi:MAG: prolipoprotein diacylglyceryl transferase [Firmicutes bacterium]|nr:prolipoprotein diacylglyceryl transferase [Bacillota bacterium]
METSIAFNVGPLTVRWYGIIVAAAFAAGSYLAYREAARQKMNVDVLLNILIIIIPAAIIGARLYYVAMRWDFYGQNLSHILRTWQGGLAVHGGIIAAVLAVFIYCHLRKDKFLSWADILVPAVAFGQAIGRWGNYLNQEAYGYETTLPWAMYIDGAYRHPTFLYESVWNLLVFIFLYILLRRRHRTGVVFASYLIAYSVGRFFIEMLRTDSLMIGSLRAAMVVSVLGVCIGLFLLNHIRRQVLPQEGLALSSKKTASRQSERSQQREPAKKQGKKNKN